MKEFQFTPAALTLLSILAYFAPWYMSDPAISLLPHYMGIFGLMLLWIFIPILILKWRKSGKQDPSTHRYACTAAFLQASLYLLWAVGLVQGYTIAF
jgi:hypothetical protein